MTFAALYLIPVSSKLSRVAITVFKEKEFTPTAISGEPTVRSGG